MMRFPTICLVLLLGTGSAIAQVDVNEIYELAEHRYADNDGVRIHYVTLGEGPLVVFLHGFPNQWYDWRYQLAALADEYQVAALSHSADTTEATSRVASTTTT